MVAEVAVQQLKTFRKALLGEGVDIDAWIRETGTGIDWSDSAYRISWGEFCAILDLLASRRGEAWLRARGADSIYDDEATLFRDGLIIGFDAPGAALPWLVAPYGPLRAVSPFIRTGFEVLEEGVKYRLTSEMLDGLPNSLAHNWFACGLFEEFPAVLFEDRASVAVEPRPDGADFLIEFAEPQGQAWRKRREARARPRPEYLIGVGETYFAMVEAQRQQHANQDRIYELERRALIVSKQQSLGELTSGVAHDFNNLLQALMGQLGLVDMNPDLDARSRTQIEEALATCSRGIDLTRRLLRYSREHPLQPEVLDVRDVLSALEPMLKNALLRGQGLSLTPPAAGVQVFAERGGLETSLLNLTVNARDAMDMEGALRIACECVEVDAASPVAPDCGPGRYVCIRVEDDGAGVSDKALPRLFDPYYTTKGDGGTGLGLSLVWGFVKQSGGHVTVNTEPGRGTAFELLLPRYDT